MQGVADAKARADENARREQARYERECKRLDPLIPAMLSSILRKIRDTAIQGRNTVTVSIGEHHYCDIKLECLDGVCWYVLDKLSHSLIEDGFGVAYTAIPVDVDRDSGVPFGGYTDLTVCW